MAIVINRGTKQVQTTSKW